MKVLARALAYACRAPRTHQHAVLWLRPDLRVRGTAGSMCDVESEKAHLERDLKVRHTGPGSQKLLQAQPPCTRGSLDQPETCPAPLAEPQHELAGRGTGCCTVTSLLPTAPQCSPTLHRSATA